MFNCISSRVFNVLQGLLAIKAKSLGDLLDTLGTEGSLSVDVDHFAVAPAFLLWKLGCYA